MPPPQGGAPFGQAPATTATPNAGQEAAGVQKLGAALKILESAVADLGSTSEAGQLVLDTIKKMGKFLAPGTSTPAGEKNVAQQLQMKAAQQGPMIAQMRQAAAQGGGGGAPPAAAA